jgi:hypothetical protein
MHVMRMVSLTSSDRSQKKCEILLLDWKWRRVSIPFETFVPAHPCQAHGVLEAACHDHVT